MTDHQLQELHVAVEESPCLVADEARNRHVYTNNMEYCPSKGMEGVQACKGVFMRFYVHTKGVCMTVKVHGSRYFYRETIPVHLQMR